MAKITIALSKVQKGGALENFYYNNVILRSDVDSQTIGANAIAVGDMELPLSDVIAILEQGGSVDGLLMAIKAPISLLSVDVPSTLPNSTKLDGTGAVVPKTFADWLVPAAEIWKSIPQGAEPIEICFYTNPFAGNTGQYLTGAQIKTIYDLGGEISVLTVLQAKVLLNENWERM